jgi:hypothetical protein
MERKKFIYIYFHFLILTPLIFYSVYCIVRLLKFNFMLFVYTLDQTNSITISYISRRSGKEFIEFWWKQGSKIVIIDLVCMQRIKNLLIGRIAFKFLCNFYCTERKTIELLYFISNREEITMLQKKDRSNWNSLHEDPFINNQYQTIYSHHSIYRE